MDKIFVHRNSKILPRWTSYNILAEPWMLKQGKEYKEPLAFNEKTGQGFSDHLPIGINVSLQAGVDGFPLEEE